MCALLALTEILNIDIRSSDHRMIKKFHDSQSINCINYGFIASLGDRRFVCINLMTFLISLYRTLWKSRVWDLSMRAVVNKSTHYLLSLEPVKRSGRRHVATHDFTRVRSPLAREARRLRPAPARHEASE